MTRFIIFRHGQTDWNVERRVMGQTDVPLNNLGQKQAKKLATRLKNEKIDVFYSSPLQRAYKTTRLVASLHKKDVGILPELIEMGFGEYEGKTKIERLALFPWFDIANDKHRKKLGMETFSSTVPVLIKIIEQLSKQHQGQTIVLGTHDQKMRALLIALGMPETLKSELMKNCAVSIVENNDELKILCHNDNSHLEDLV